MIRLLVSNRNFSFSVYTPSSGAHTLGVFKIDPIPPSSSSPVAVHIGYLPVKSWRVLVPP